jgi:hypothetical protein
MVHDVLQQRFTGFNSRWTRYNNGIPYGRNVPYPETGEFLDEYTMINISEDVAHTFHHFADFNIQRALRNTYDRYHNFNFWKKAVFMEEAIESALGVSGAFGIVAPQTPSPWARDAVDRAFGTNGAIGRESNDDLLYQAPMTRGAYARYVSGMLERIVYTQHDKEFVWFSRRGGTANANMVNPATGEGQIITFTPMTGAHFRPFTNTFMEVSLLVHLGLMRGINHATFHPYGYVTRDELAYMLEAVCTFLGIPAVTMDRAAGTQYWEAVSYEEAIYYLVKIFDSATERTDGNE